MRYRFSLLFWLLITSPWLQAETLVFAALQSSSEDRHMNQPISDIIEYLFRGSRFELQRLEVPRGARLMAETRKHNIDIFIGSYSPKILQEMSFGLVEVHPLPIMSAKRGFYALRSSNFSAKTLEQLHHHHLGIVKIPANLRALLLGRKTAKVTGFRSNDSAAKGLITGRIDIMAGLNWATPYTFERIGEAKQVIKIGEGLAVQSHVYIRTSLPADTKTMIRRLLDQRIPQLRESGALELILTQYR